MLHIDTVSVERLDMALAQPFGISSGAQQSAANVLVRVRLSDGSEGLGEAAPFPAANGETQEQAIAALQHIGPKLSGRSAALRPIAAWLAEEVPAAASARCAVEVALLDAICRAHRLSMWQWFGAAEPALVTDYTITTGSAADAARDAASIAAKGFGTIKLKVGGVASHEDESRIGAVTRAAPGTRLILDGNCAFGEAAEILRLADLAESLGAKVVLLEQPFARGDVRAEQALTATGKYPVCADESATSPDDVVAIARDRRAHVVNIKTMKSGFFAAQTMALTARALGLGFMIGAMVESELSLSASLCLAAGLGGASFVDLDTHLFFAASPMRGGFRQDGERLDASVIDVGHGVRLG